MLLFLGYALLGALALVLLVLLATSWQVWAFMGLITAICFLVLWLSPE